MRMRHLRFQVAPRYTSGSPAQVDPDTAAMVAAQEKQAYERYLTGLYGDEGKTKAENEGVERIAYVTEDKGNIRHFYDLISGRHFRVHLKKSKVWYYWYVGETFGVEVEIEWGIFRDVTKAKLEECMRYDPFLQPVA